MAHICISFKLYIHVSVTECINIFGNLYVEVVIILCSLLLDLSFAEFKEERMFILPERMIHNALSEEMYVTTHKNTCRFKMGKNNLVDSHFNEDIYSLTIFECFQVAYND